MMDGPNGCVTALHNPQVSTLTYRPPPHTVHALRPKQKSDPKFEAEGHHAAESDTSPEEEELWIACRNCRQRLTRPSEQTRINGSHLHTFANPSGVVFEVSCYRSATGYTLSGPPSSDFTWFAGHNWQIAICSSCLIHLGWRFSGSTGEIFLGFITDRLTEISTSI